MANNIFITGGAGFLGSRLLIQILANTDSSIFLLTRPCSRHSNPEIRLRGLLESLLHDNILLSKYLRRITIIEGDIIQKGLCMTGKILSYLKKNLDIIYHLAAELDIRNSYKHISLVNVSGTVNILDFAMQCKKTGRFKKVNYISTAYVLGTKGLEDFSFSENHLELSQGFNNLYEKTKYEAEMAVRDYRKKSLLVDVFRPSIIIDSLPITDYRLFSEFFRPFRFFISGIFKCVPARADSRYNLVSVDDAAKAIFIISDSANAKNRNYHIVNNRYISLKRILDIAVDVFPSHKPLCVSCEKFDFDSLSNVQKKMISPFVPYLNFRAKFDSHNALTILKRKKFRYQSLTDSEIRHAFEYIRDNRM
jgi:nucleoside-diphosphate-sugar epimerase